MHAEAPESTPLPVCGLSDAKQMDHIAKALEDIGARLARLERADAATPDQPRRTSQHGTPRKRGNCYNRPIPKRLSGFVKGGTRASQHV